MWGRIVVQNPYYYEQLHKQWSLLWKALTCFILIHWFVYQGLTLMFNIQIAGCKKGPPKNPINQKFKGTSFNLISQRRILHVPHWSMSEFRGLRDCGAGLLHLDRDSYWVHLSLGVGQGLVCKSWKWQESSYPWFCPMVSGLAKKI